MREKRCSSCFLISCHASFFRHMNDSVKDLIMSLNPSDYAAWWGACIATIVCMWDVYKWKHNSPGFSVKVKCPTEMDLKKSGNFLSVSVEVINGQSPLSIRAVSLRHFKRRWHYAFLRPDRVSNLSRNELPKKLDPAEVWMIPLDESDDDFYLSREDLTKGILIVDLYGTHRSRPVSARILQKKDK